MLSPADIESHAARVERDGYTVLEGVVDDALLTALRDDLERIEREEQVKPASNIFEGTSTVRIYNLLARGKLFEAIPVHDQVLPVVERVLDRGCLVSSLSSMISVAASRWALIQSRSAWRRAALTTSRKPSSTR